ncbi:hypothetical protein F5J12DRAFT_928594 [Pisolithus orientalis]|uniref:uncharacterized protein n=1 Tax=Pisolithus orientalis TaxID=936130 RepID=UPI002224436E|nr:uncharacterized protein F5J12DRAFT_928594 [Pisolithus orientalis]KAI6000132.1 hypothetical protein F5J12DRAFT_928594 [Pisolithus orientalis]
MHLSTILWSLLVALLGSELLSATQVPLNVVGDRGAGVANNAFDSNPTHWNFEDLPSPNATGHLVFETVYSLLQHWSNTRMRNGHTIVPGTVPTGTYLYHATNRHRVPTVPDWVAMNPEESTFFCMGPSENGCWHLTLGTIQPLKVLYSGGTSAAKLVYGNMDTQDVLTWGKVLPNQTSMEREGINTLCQWGSQHGLDGFIRMEMDLWQARTRLTYHHLYAGSWSNRSPGEQHVRLDLANVISFYDTDLIPSLVPARFGKERWDHRLLNIADEDIRRAKSRIEEGLARPRELSSGVDWMALIKTIVHRYADRLELNQYLLGSITWDNPGAILDAARKTQVQLRPSFSAFGIQRVRCKIVQRRNSVTEIGNSKGRCELRGRLLQLTDSSVVVERELLSLRPTKVEVAGTDKFRPSSLHSSRHRRHARMLKPSSFQVYRTSMNDNTQI